MDTVARNFEFVGAATRRAVQTLREQLGTDRARVEGLRRGGQFLDLLRVLLDALDSALDGYIADFAAADNVGKDSLVRSVRQLHAHTQLIHLMATPWHAAIDEDTSLQLGFQYFLDEATRALVKEESDIILVADSEYMYSVEHRPLRLLAHRLGAKYPVGVAPIALYYPAQERRGLFLHVLLVHELGHSAVEDHGLMVSAEAELGDPTQLEALKARATADLVSWRGIGSLDARLDIDGYVDRWLEELLCDALALAYLGPAYVFAFAAMVYTISTNDAGPDHPPTALRIQLMLDGMKTSGWYELVRERLPETLAWLDSIGAEARTPQLDYPEALDKAMQLLSPAAHSVAVRHLGAASFGPSAYTGLEEALNEMLNNSILPAQLDDQSAPDRRAILLATIFSLLRDSGDEPASLHSILGNTGTQEFLAKALEMSTVLSVWRSL